MIAKTVIALGTIFPSNVIGPLVSIVKSGPAYAEKVKQLWGYLPYSLLAFLLGLGIGFVVKS